MSANALLPGLLAIAVPLHLERFRAQGGPTEADVARAMEFGERIGRGCEEQVDEAGQHVAFLPHPVYGEADAADLLYRSKKKGETAAMFNGLAFTLAVMAYFPGGVSFAGLHFEETL